ncbi:MAG TPA: sulfatase, partial [Pirellulales bacterium]|nr:sulfatase [Pirellulales bacterium]
TIFGECFEHNAVDIDVPSTSLKWRWCVRDQWKLILPHPPNVEGSAELYDLASDPQEQHNLAERDAARVAELTKAINQWWPAE